MYSHHFSLLSLTSLLSAPEREVTSPSDFKVVGALHSRLTHSYLLNNEERPECIPCNSNFSLKHVLIDCVDVADVRQTFYNANSLSNLFTNVAGDTILQFIKEIDLYSYITYVLDVWFLSF
jgi:hypothetical protein